MSDKWIMRGIDEKDRDCIRNAEELRQYILQIGFLPLFRNDVPGFSVEEHVSARYWWTDDEEKDPWCWRMSLAESEDIAYGKFFDGKAGFVSKEWFPVFACARRDGYDFDSRADEGLCRPEDQKLMELFAGRAVCDTTYLRNASGLRAKFEPVITRLMQETYIIIKEFAQRVNRSGQPYGWFMSRYTTPECKWGYEHVTGFYPAGTLKAEKEIVNHLRFYFPDADFKHILGLAANREL